MTTDVHSPRQILDFWFDLTDDVAFGADPKFDRLLEERFGGTLAAARRGKLDAWEKTPEGALALVLLLDQMSRNVHRGTPAMYEQDEKALEMAERAIARGEDMALPKEQRRWLYMPFMHSEKLADQERCVELCRASELADTLPYAIDHADIVRRFGRFPHRNAILGRTSTRGETDYLDGGGFKG
ncbi:MAG: DUF924 family protein [Parvibaculaceae bacterium]